MGACLSLTARSNVDEQNAAAERAMREAKREQLVHSKLLLLGTGDSGKSTMLKQIRVINAIPFTPEEIEGFRRIIFSNLISSMTLIREIMEDEAFDVDCPDEITQLFDEVQSAGDISTGDPYPSRCYYVLQRLWNDVDVQKAFRIGQQFALPDNMTYFFGSLPRLFNTSYTPTEQDILHSRVTTLGVTETQFVLSNRTISVIDVGGQRSERRKWIHCFQDVTAIIFLVSLSGYDQTLVEDRQVNQMQDAMTVWQSICSSSWFERTSLILLLNKEDIFIQKFSHSNIRRFFPDFAGDEGTYADGEKYFKERFAHLHKRGVQVLQDTAGAPNRPKLPARSDATGPRRLYTHFTTATDTNLIRNVMRAVNETVLAGNLANILL
ncbi:related to guanine nucleotide-binding protein alpha-2 subunit [Serendipita indica DSM 11827]|uniref:Related to guanine nucleotide-binding protein alpha-2 subunit n=1 Tax=Serendipita indica (strain DSM 11827) TaxID=1109443 RepID=G4TPK7_SERID|nr:related to guanine nucleotide-binding protein alpha-2 subunit [Serendipita indica DSM 11827]